MARQYPELKVPLSFLIARTSSTALRCISPWKLWYRGGSHETLTGMRGSPGQRDEVMGLVETSPPILSVSKGEQKKVLPPVVRQAHHKRCEKRFMQYPQRRGTDGARVIEPALVEVGQ
jgi:hypothetical protein